jgi:hypothetical protein
MTSTNTPPSPNMITGPYCALPLTPMITSVPRCAIGVTSIPLMSASGL